MNNPHGDFETGVSKQLLLFSARGPWNDETMKTGVIRMADDISKIKEGTSWGQVSCLYGESIMPPSTFDIFVKQTRIRKSRGLCFLAVVILDTDIMLTIKQQISKCYELAEVPFAFFDNIPDALQAVEQKELTFVRSDAEDFFARFNFSRTT
jgi:hypothetical protein